MALDWARLWFKRYWYFLKNYNSKYKKCNDIHETVKTKGGCVCV